MLDGVVYRANADLEIEIPSDNELIPYPNKKRNPKITYIANLKEIFNIFYFQIYFPL